MVKGGRSPLHIKQRDVFVSVCVELLRQSDHLVGARLTCRGLNWKLRALQHVCPDNMKKSLLLVAACLAISGCGAFWARPKPPAAPVAAQCQEPKAVSDDVISAIQVVEGAKGDINGSDVWLLLKPLTKDYWAQLDSACTSYRDAVQAAAKKAIKIRSDVLTPRLHLICQTPRDPGDVDVASNFDDQQKASKVALQLLNESTSACLN